MAAHRSRVSLGLLTTFVLTSSATLPPACVASPAGAGRAALIGVWRGTSTCTDRVAAPACHDEVVVYEFAAGAKPEVILWRADKVVDGQRLAMGEMELTFDSGEACWRAEFTSPRSHSVWCLTVDGAHMTGTGRNLPANQIIRKIDVRKD
jgi:hypothetical protein